jgi:hypothetical protein
VPFCAAAMVVAAVVLARCSAPERVRLIADSGAVGGTHSAGYRERLSMLCSRGRRPPCLLRLLRPCNNTSGAGPTLLATRSERDTSNRSECEFLTDE